MTEWEQISAASLQNLVEDLPRAAIANSCKLRLVDLKQDVQDLPPALFLDDVSQDYLRSVNKGTNK